MSGHLMLYMGGFVDTRVRYQSPLTLLGLKGFHSEGNNATQFANLGTWGFHRNHTQESFYHYHMARVLSQLQRLLAHTNSWLPNSEEKMANETHH
jgi:hypothetical protein